jgi:DNA-binding transcriptional LysR family regulator
MRDLDLAVLRIFKTVAEEGGVTRAAERLNRVQSNVTTRVKQLEERLGVALFTRRGKRLHLTAAGIAFLDYAERLLRLSAEAESVLHADRPRGDFRLGSMESTAGMRLPAVLSRYHRAWPEVRIDLSTGTAGKLVEQLHRGGIDAAFAAEPFARDGLEVCPAFREELVLISPLGAPPVTTPVEACTRSVIAFPVGCAYRYRLEGWIGRERTLAKRFHEYASYHALIACVAAGGGIAIAPRSVVEAIVSPKQIRIQALPRPVAEATTYLMWRKGYESPALRALVDLVGAVTVDGKPRKSRVKRTARRSA